MVGISGKKFPRAKGSDKGSQGFASKLARQAISPRGETQRELHSDSSTLAWAGLDLKTGKFVQEFWREKASLHINVKELEAAIATVKSLAKPRERVLLSVDKSVTFS